MDSSTVSLTAPVVLIEVVPLVAFGEKTRCQQKIKDLFRLIRLRIFKIIKVKQGRIAEKNHTEVWHFIS